MVITNNNSKTNAAILALAGLSLSSVSAAESTTVAKETLKVAEKSKVASEKLPLLERTSREKEEIISTSTSSKIFGAKTRTNVDLYEGVVFGIAGTAQLVDLNEEIVTAKKLGPISLAFANITETEELENVSRSMGSVEVSGALVFAMASDYNAHAQITYTGNIVNGLDLDMVSFVVGGSRVINDIVGTASLGGAYCMARDLYFVTGRFGGRTQLLEFNFEGGISGTFALTKADEQDALKSKFLKSKKDNSVLSVSTTMNNIVGLYGKISFLI